MLKKCAEVSNGKRTGEGGGGEGKEERKGNAQINIKASPVSKYHQLMNSIHIYDMGKIQSLILLDCISNVGLGWFLANYMVARVLLGGYLMPQVKRNQTKDILVPKYSLDPSFNGSLWDFCACLSSNC